MHTAENNDYKLISAEIFYHGADRPETLQTLIWQDYDLAPDYPELRQFLSYWTRHIDGVIQSVNIISANRSLDPRTAYPAQSLVLH